MKRLILPIAIAAILLPELAGAFSVSPAIIELAGDRGASVTSEVVVKNTGTDAQTYYLQTIKFLARENSGSPMFVSPQVDKSGLAQWIALSKSQVTVQGQSQAKVPFTVAVPSDVASGSYSGAILVSSTPFTTADTSIQARTAVLVLFTVNGETNAKLALLDFVPTDATGISAAATGGFRYRVQNQGNVYAAPQGSVTVKDLFGRTLAVADANPDGGRVLPGMTRTYDGAFRSDLFAVGPVTAVLRLTYPGGAEPIVASYGFWVLPPLPLAVAGFVLVGACLAVIAVRRAKR
jgi:hypothetical protein